MIQSGVVAIMRKGFRLALLGLGASLALGAGPDIARDALPPPSPAFDPPRGALLAEDFGTGRLRRWRADRDSVWSTWRGVLRAQLPDRRQEHSFLYAGDTTWTDYAVDLDVCGMRGVDKGLVVRVVGERGLGLDLRGPGYHDLRLNLNEFPMGRVAVENANGVWHHVRVTIQDRRCRVQVDGRQLVDRVVSRRLEPRGGIALAAYTGGVAECSVYYDNVIVTPLPRP
jgi:hypothetical protein